MDMIIDACIPAKRPGLCLKETILRLFRQKQPVRYIYIVNTCQELFDETLLMDLAGYEKRVFVQHISQAEFDHGYARDLMARQSDADFLLFMTQDASVVDVHLTENLLRAFREDDLVAGAYARQLPYRNCDIPEKMTRRYNYPANSSVKSAEDEERLGVKLYFCSNVCAMYRRDVYMALGGFQKGAIFNEDMIYAYQMIQAGYRIAYCADARVRHSHNYSLMQCFRRSFDMAVSQAQHPEIFLRGKSEAEGSRMVIDVVRRLLLRGHVFSVVSFFLSCVAKYSGYFLGKRYKKLPKAIVLRCTGSRWWFERENKS